MDHSEKMPTPEPAPHARLEAVKALAALRLPAGDIRDMENESVPAPEDLLP